MIVKTTEQYDDGYFKLPRGKEYAVMAISYIAKNSAVDKNAGIDYWILAEVENLRPLPWCFSATHFEVVNTGVPSDWRAGEIDMKEMAKQKARIYENEGHKEISSRIKKYINDLGDQDYKVLLVGMPEMLDYDFYINVHDINTEPEQEELIIKRLEEYRKN